MTLGQVLKSCSDGKFSVCTDAEKIARLSRLDAVAVEEIFSTHEGSAPAFAGYDATTPRDTQLLIPAPYDEVYGYYLEAGVDYQNGEYAHFNNSNAMFENAWQRFAAHYHRTHKPRNPGNDFK